MNESVIRYLLDRIRGLEPSDQVKLCESFIEEFNILNSSKVDDYDKEKSIRFIRLLSDYLKDLKDQEEIKRVESMIDRFNYLRHEHQERIIKSLCFMVEKEYENENLTLK